MLLNENKVNIMIKKKSSLDQLTKVDDVTRAMTSVRKNSAIESALASAYLSKDTVSKAMAAALRNQSEQSSVAKMTKDMTRQITLSPMQEAIKEAMAPTKIIQAALGQLPSTELAKAMDTIASQSMAKQLQLPKINSNLPRLTNSRQPDESTTTFRDVAELGKAIREVRKKKGLTQQQFADLAGVGRRFLSELESGKPTLEVGKVLKVTAAAGIQLMYKTPS